MLEEYPKFDKNEYINFILTKKYFYKNGKNIKSRNWLILFYLVRDFYLIFKFKYNIKTKELVASFVPLEKRFLNKIFFFRLYLKLLNYVKWTTINMKILFSFFKKAVAICTKEVVTYQN